MVRLLDQSSQLRRVLRFDDAHARADEAIALAGKLGDRIGLAMAHRQKGIVCQYGGKLAESHAWFEQSLAEFEALGNRAGMADALYGLTVTAIQTGDAVAARQSGNRALAIDEEIGNRRQKGWLLLQLNRFEPSAAARDATLVDVLAIAAASGDDELRGLALRGVASSQFGRGDFASARTTYEAAIPLIEKAGALDALAAAYVELGRVFRAHGDAEAAMAWYERAIAVLAPTSERYTIVEATNAKAVALGILGRSAEALAVYERGLMLARESGNQRLIDFMEGNLAGGLIAARQYARAIPALEAAIAKKPELPVLGFRYKALAVALLRVGRAADALAPADEAVRIARELNDVDGIQARLTDRSQVLAALGRLEAALADAREAVDLLEHLRTKLVPSDFSKRGYAERTQVGYAQVLDVLARRGEAAEALQYAEQGRARAFLDLLAARESPEDAALETRGVPAALSPSNPERPSTSLGQPLDVDGVKEVARRIHSTIVAYWVEDDALLVWTIRPGTQPVLTRVPAARDTLASLVTATTAPLREAAKGPSTRGEDDAVLPMRGLSLLALTRDDQSAWRELYTLIVAPIRRELPPRGGRVTIIPHGPLLQLSFAALQSAAGRYLIEDYELHYAPSISALAFTARLQEAAGRNAGGPWAIIGNPASLPMVGGRVLPALPGAAREIDAVASLSPKGAALRLDGLKADEASFTRLLDASHPSVLHFATHGFAADPKRPPFLALNRRGAAPAEDGALTADEIYGLRLATDLVVLSACRSGTGQVGSDGVYGLARAFLAAGSPSVVATFWDVVDEATATLMSGFYRRYAATRAKGKSLRGAQLALLADLRAGKLVVAAGGRPITLPEHPLLWAAFFLTGEP